MCVLEYKCVCVCACVTRTDREGRGLNEFESAFVPSLWPCMWDWDDGAETALNNITLFQLVLSMVREEGPKGPK